MKAHKLCVKTQNSAKIHLTTKITIYFQNFSSGSRQNNTPYLHACNSGWESWEGPHLDILSRGPRVPSYATACNNIFLTFSTQLNETLDLLCTCDDVCHHLSKYTIVVVSLVSRHGSGQDQQTPIQSVATFLFDRSSFDLGDCSRRTSSIDYIILIQQVLTIIEWGWWWRRLMMTTSRFQVAWPQGRPSYNTSTVVPRMVWQKYEWLY